MLELRALHTNADTMRFTTFVSLDITHVACSSANLRDISVHLTGSVKKSCFVFIFSCYL